MACVVLEVILSVLVWSATAQRDDCCFGKSTVSHGETVMALPSCCVSFVCQNGNILPQHVAELTGVGCCEFDGLLYPNGAQLSAYCVPLICQRGNWTVSHEIEECCKHCSLYDDPHIVTFDNYYYDWHGTCNYSIAQVDFTHNPEIGVFSDFEPCFGGASCLDTTTFKNDRHTIISINHVSGEPLYQIFVNGHPHHVPDTGVQPVQSAYGSHPVLAWRDQGCLYLIGSSRIMIQACPHRLDVWAYPTHASHLDGLCGHFNFYSNDDFTSRDETVFPLQQYPLAFPESWRTSDQRDRECLYDCHNCEQETAENPCRANPMQRREYSTICRRVLTEIIGRDVTLQSYLASCEFDVCMSRQAGRSQQEEQLWLREMQKLVNHEKLILARTNGQWWPNPLFPPVEGVCTPGSEWKEDCNWCKCSFSGLNTICTHHRCSETYEHELGNDSCTNSSWWKHDHCNWCQCINGGAVCSYDECITNPSTITNTPAASTVPPFYACFLTAERGPCTNTQLRYYYDFPSGTCKQFLYGGCEGNSNNFGTEQECIRRCGQFSTVEPSTTLPPTTLPPTPPQCLLPVEVGPCEAAIPRYYYNPVTDQCQLFYYGGCFGNQNNFDTAEECHSTCGGLPPQTTAVPSTVVTQTTESDRCSQPIVAGTCNSFVSRYAYNGHTNSCQLFYYSGCGGNDNRFLTIYECLQECTDLTVTVPTTTTDPSICYLNYDTGNCFSYHTRYFYRSDTMKCEPFLYSGCGGNPNNFRTQQECEETCAQVTATTTPPPTSASTTCLPDFLACPQDCQVTRVDVPGSDCPACVCVTDPSTTTPPQCPMLICPTNCPVMIITDSNGCQDCVCTSPATTVASTTCPQPICPQDCIPMIVINENDCPECVCDVVVVIG